jgi:hypothetical protein
VLSGVPQGSVLGPVLFICYINNMRKNVKGDIKMFADDTKISSAVNSEEDHQKLQNDLTNLEKWSQNWLLRFNTKKCKVMHLGYHNSKYQFTMGSGNDEHKLENTECEKDLGVHVNPSLNFSKHCQKVVNKANRIL